MSFNKDGGMEIKMINKENKQISDELLKMAAENYMEKRGSELLKEVEHINREKKNQPTDKQIEKFKKLCNREFKKNNRKASLVYKVVAAAAVILIVFNISINSVPAIKKVVLNFLAYSKQTHTTIKVDEKELISKEPAEEFTETTLEDREPAEEFTETTLEDKEPAEESTETAAEDKKADGQSTGTAPKATEPAEKDRTANTAFDKDYQITYLPEGFYKAAEKVLVKQKIIDYFHSGDENKIILFSQKKYNSVVNIDTEKSDVTYIDINGSKAMVAQKAEQVNIVWRVEDYFISITTQGIGKKETISVAKSVEKTE